MASFCDKGGKFVSAIILKNETFQRKCSYINFTNHYKIYFLFLKNCEHQI